MSQMALFSSDTDDPSVSDVAGLLACSGQTVPMAGGTRVSVVVDAQWRARALAQELELIGLAVEIARSEEGSPVVRTMPTPLLDDLRRLWSSGAVKAVPPGWTPSPRALRQWTIAAGRRDGDKYLLGLDVHAPDTHPALATALMRVGVAPILTGARGGLPAVRIAGKRRVTRFVEMVGAPPDEPDALADWPIV
ncbi:MAG TPA: hypothetical protein PK331_16735 [Gordonia sp. (in: high G+C Gram-positive bacteria)]|uniref:hypothetical protein n=1 Tax=unclassified Gordonia (in: high G+C Gram-positive bacteria) TaxID=2657482 RepID=UPI000FA8271B|nr:MULTISPECIES: hypothetical protein [unclassified Gordonia (in: high G+C Gram-positive bacteria)]RUP38731.1 MAG: hypothetical protein EKK60_08900 [Gordonia sp. (in: high G+C Gram-positive bacteria)]HNP58345.1 hypothetical protein [Gordonia sp. (in: high G+C Gram-positive bacteria)]HRC52556.1 hypothetical protein [Gordonia sp. (in: high G+C Gram-positive bacteria)]